MTDTSSAPASLLDAVAAPLSADRPRLDARAGVLVGGRCGNCGAMSWPTRAVCHRCGRAEISPAPLPVRGTLTTFTKVWIPVGDIEPPYVLGLVRFDDPDADGLKVFAHIRGIEDRDVRVPLGVELRLDEGAEPPFWFVPTD